MDHYQQQGWESNGSEVTKTYIKLAKAWTEDEFSNLAMQAKHPTTMEPPIDDHTKTTSFKILTEGTEAWRTKASVTLDDIKRQVAQLAPREEDTRNKVHEAVRPIIQKKNTICMGNPLKKIGYKDKLLAHRCRTGFRTTGATDET